MKFLGSVRKIFSVCESRGKRRLCCYGIETICQNFVHVIFVHRPKLWSPISPCLDQRTAAGKGTATPGLVSRTKVSWHQKSRKALNGHYENDRLPISAEVVKNWETKNVHLPIIAITVLLILGRRKSNSQARSGLQAGFSLSPYLTTNQQPKYHLVLSRRICNSQARFQPEFVWRPIKPASKVQNLPCFDS